MNLLYLSISFVCIYAEELSFDLVTDYSVNDCLRENNEDYHNYFALDTDGFPYCAKYAGIQPARCRQGGKLCEPGLKCGASSKCEIDTTSCFKYYANVAGNTKFAKLLWTPDCQQDGTWAPLQCKGGSSGRCFCYDKRGNRIFGDAFNENSANMTCACSRRKAELLDSSNPNKRTFVSLHCDTQGNYEELQCDSGHCWCAEPKTGELKSVIVPQKAMQYLKCYDKLQGSQYLRKCETEAYAQAKIMEVMKKHGSSTSNTQMVLCEGDGSYGPYTIEKTTVYCVDRTNKHLKYQSTIEDIDSIDCNCGHDEDLYSRLGREFNLICSLNGNYKPFQNIIEENQIKNFCVDRDGNTKLIVKTKETDSYCEQFYD